MATAGRLERDPMKRSHTTQIIRVAKVRHGDVIVFSEQQRFAGGAGGIRVERVEPAPDGSSDIKVSGYTVYDSRELRQAMGLKRVARDLPCDAGVRVLWPPQYIVRQEPPNE
jgi:hypothetical protein